MCERNSPDKNEASMGCVSETPHIIKKKDASTECVRETPHIQMKPAWDVCTGCVRETPQINKIEAQNGMCKRNSPDKIKPARGV